MAPPHLSGTSATLPGRDEVVLAAGYLIWGGWACFTLHAVLLRPSPAPWIGLLAAFFPAVFGTFSFAFGGYILALVLGLLLNLVIVVLWAAAVGDLRRRNRRAWAVAVASTLLLAVAPLLR